MTLSQPLPRLAALAIAIVGWIGLGTQFGATMSDAGQGNIAMSLWLMFFYFTIIGNLLSALIFTAIALGRPPTPFGLGGVTVLMLLIGIVYNTLLRGMLELSGGAWLADFLNHTINPILVTLFWLLLAPRGGLRWRDPLLWALLPVLYFVYGLVRGGIEGAYPYPFMNPAKLGVTQVAINAAGMAVAFLVGGLLLVAYDRMMSRRR